MSSSSSSASSSRSPTPEPQPKTKKTETLKRKLKQDEDVDSDSDSDSAPVVDEKPKKKSKKAEGKTKVKKPKNVDAEPAEDELAITDEPALSHAERRRQQKRLAKQKAAEEAGVDLSEKPSKKRKLKDGSAAAVEGGEGKGKDAPAAKPRQNSVWVGNMSFKTTQENLRTFFASCGEITRINLPIKPGRRPNQPVENRGFAYVDFATPEGKQAAIALSEQPLVGRKLLIKDGDDFAGRPIAPGTDVKTTDSTLSQKIHSKTAQKILRRQKQPPGPTLFVGNLPFETTEEDIRTLFESHRPVLKKEKGAWKSSFKDEGKKKADDDDEKEAESSSSSGESDSGSDSDSDSDREDEEKEDKAKEKAKKKTKEAVKPKQEQKKDDFILKVRMGTFEDSGACKGFTFIDFSSIDNATAALINIKNHHFNGRELKVEYAGLDAIRRGAAKHLVRAAMESKGKTSGAPRKPRGDNAAGDRDGGNGRSLNARPPRGSKPSYGGGEGDDGGAAMEVDHEEAPAKKAEGPDRRFRKEFDRKGRARPTPGAALALAKRETPGIVPSQGKKITF